MISKHLISFLPDYCIHHQSFTSSHKSPLKHNKTMVPILFFFSYRKNVHTFQENEQTDKQTNSDVYHPFMYSTVYEIFTDTRGASNQHVIQWNKPKNDCESESIKQKHFQPELQYFKRTINQYLDHHTAKSKQPNFTQCTSEQSQKHLKSLFDSWVKSFVFLRAKWKCNKHYSQDATNSLIIHFVSIQT